MLEAQGAEGGFCARAMARATLCIDNPRRLPTSASERPYWRTVAYELTAPENPLVFRAALTTELALDLRASTTEQRGHSGSSRRPHH